jgi:hypothetical protein
MPKSKNDTSSMKNDTEGYMSSIELDTIEKNIAILRTKIKGKNQQLPAWIQSKITRAADFTTDAAQYLNTGKELEEAKATSFTITGTPLTRAQAKVHQMTPKQRDELRQQSPEQVTKLAGNADIPKFIPGLPRTGKGGSTTGSMGTESTIVDRILKSLNEGDDCSCPESKKEKEKGYVKGSKLVMSVEDIAGKHGVTSERIQKQLKMGIKVEGEHTTNKEEAEGIALQHLAEKPNYYTELKKVERVKSESTVITDLFGNPKFEFIDLVLPPSLKEARKMKGKDPCWKGYEMVGTKKKRGKRVPNCVPVTEATLPVQNGQVMQILFSWRGKTMASQLFFPQVRIPNRKEVTDAIVKVYPDARVLSYRVGSQNVGQPIIQLPNTKSKNYLLQNKTIGEAANSKKKILNEEGPSLSVGRGEKLSVEAGGGLTAKGRERYNRATGSKLKAPVTGKVKKGSRAWKRRKNFCSRSRSWKGPRGLAARRRWKC